MIYMSFEEIPVWRQARQFNQLIFKALVPRLENIKRFSLADQLQRASLSIMLNIAEGFERRGKAEFAHFLNIARGSASESRSIFWILYDLDILSQNELNHYISVISSIAKQLCSFRNYILKSNY